MQTISGIHYQTGQNINITMEGIIRKVTVSETKTGKLPYIAPGLIDLQVNGFKGIDFNSPLLTVADVTAITLALLARGVTTYYPTVITNSDERIKASLTTINRACNESAVVKACIGGIHLEGPFISPLDGPVGAHDKQFVKAPDWQWFCTMNEAAEGLIRIITLSPEWPRAADFTRQCAKEGIIVSIGHTAANTVQIARVVNAGALMSTHLGNATHQVLPRHPNYIWDQLADDRLWAGFIGDEFHLPHPVIKVILKVKENRAILVSDNVSLSGMPPGNYTTPVGGHVVLTAEGKLHLKGKPGVLAGSAQTLVQAIKHLCKQELSILGSAWDLASVNPLCLITKGRTGLHEGCRADLVVFYDNDKAFDILATYKNGVKMYQA